MRINKYIMCLAIGMISFGSTAQRKSKTMKLESDIDSVSYALGVNIADNMKAQGFEGLNVEALAKAMSDVLGDGELLITKEDCGPMINEYMQAKQAEKADLLKAEGEKFLAENAKRKDVVSLPSGLQYEIMIKGDGPKPVSTDKVYTHYHGTLIDGTVFDSSVDRGTPIEFGVTQVIKGWTEALQLMPVGSKWKLFVPWDLAYGARGSGAAIGPFTTLIFEVELKEIR